MNTKDIQGIIFDYGGTIDTQARHWAHVIWEGYQEAGIPVTNEQFREAYVYAERALAKAPIIQPTDTFPVLMQKKLECETQHLVECGIWQPTCVEQRRHMSDVAANYCADYAKRTVQESRSTLLLLAEKYPMVLVSNFYGNIETILRDYELSHLFTHVIESAVVGVRKPDPRIYQMGVEALGMKSDHVLVVGDSFGKDILPAHSIGCNTAWMKGEGWNSDETNDESIPDFIISSLQELETFLL